MHADAAFSLFHGNFHAPPGSNFRGWIITTKDNDYRFHASASLGKIDWLLVWNIFYFSICWECHHTN